MPDSEALRERLPSLQVFRWTSEDVEGFNEKEGEKGMRDNCQWLNFRWGLDTSYVDKSEAPILLELCRKHGRFWDGEHYYKLQGDKVILRWPDWRNNYRIDMEKVRLHANLGSQKRLELEVEAI